MMSWSIPRGWRTSNPCAKVKKLKIGEGYAGQIYMALSDKELDLAVTESRLIEVTCDD